MGLSGRKDTCLGCSPLDTLSVIKESPHLPKRKPNVVFLFFELRLPQFFPAFRKNALFTFGIALRLRRLGVNHEEG